MPKARDTKHLAEKTWQPPKLPPMPELPSVADIVDRGRILTELYVDEPPTMSDLVDRAMAQEAALFDLAATMPAVTPRDALAQLYIAELIINRLDGYDYAGEDPAREECARQEVCALRRLIQSALPVVARSAGTTPLEYAGEYDAQRWAKEFGGWPAAPSLAKEAAR